MGGSRRGGEGKMKGEKRKEKRGRGRIWDGKID
jgi:hypothetical protein